MQPVYSPRSFCLSWFLICTYLEMRMCPAGILWYVWCLRQCRIFCNEYEIALSLLTSLCCCCAISSLLNLYCQPSNFHLSVKKSCLFGKLFLLLLLFYDVNNSTYLHPLCSFLCFTEPNYSPQQFGENIATVILTPF